ncbi:FbpB family small basic protein [Peribacillus sp. NPDC097206]|uniref:FbpB family small basic protein n=1 Tax=unclassified Peribacillus TaxID=2675266 RepID=UPI0038247838
MPRRTKSFNQLLKENRNTLLQDKRELERIFIKIDQKATGEVKSDRQVHSS